MLRSILLAAGLVLAAYSAGQAGAERAAAHIALKGTLDEFLAESLHKRLGESRRLPAPPGKEKEAPASRAADLVIIELQTSPGPLAPALSAADAIHRLREQGVESAALVAEPGAATDTLLALAAEKLFMTAGASLGPLDPGAFRGTEPPKGGSADAEARKRLADALDRYSAWRTRLQPLYQAFLDPALEVHLVVFEGQERSPKFALGDEYRRLVASPPSPIVRSERVKKAGEPLRLSAAEAERLGVSCGTVRGADALAAQLGVPLPSLVSLRQEAAPGTRPPAERDKPAPTGAGPSRVKPGPGDTVVVIPLDGMVGDGMLHSLKRRLAMAKRHNPALIIFEMNTPGGKLDSALAIADLIFTLKEPPTVVYVNREAISAGSLIAVACTEIVMNEGSALGDCGVVSAGSPELVKSEKIDTYLRARFRNYVEGKYPTALAEAMVTLGTEVYELETTDGKLEYLTGKDYENLLRTPAHMERYKDPRNARKVVKGDELLTMTDKEARRYGFSRATVKSLSEAIALYGLAGRPVYTFQWSWSEKLVRWLDFVGPFLLSLGILAILIEFKMQGTGIFALIGLGLIAVFFLGKYMAGLAEVWEIVLFFLGLVLVAVDLFVTPGFGLLGIPGLLMMLVSVVLSLQGFALPTTPGEMADFRWSVAQLGLAALGVFVGAVLVGRYLHRAPYLGKIILAPPPPSTAATAVTEGVSAPPSPEVQERRARELMGKRGRALSTLRPAGRAEFGGEPLDVVTEGDLIEAGEPIEIAAVLGNRIVVRRAR